MKQKRAMLGLMLPYLLSMDSPVTSISREPTPPPKLTPDQLDRKFRAEQRVIEDAKDKRERKAYKRFHDFTSRTQTA